jgi:hypothetical protein
MPALIRLACLLCAALGLSACAPMLSFIGTNQTAVQIVAQIERVKIAGDGASFAASNKTITDHALSRATGKDCKIFNVLTKESVCAEKTKAVAPDSDMQPKEVAAVAPDSGTQPKEVATGQSPAAPQTQATTAHKAPAIEFSREQASGD